MGNLRNSNLRQRGPMGIDNEPLQDLLALNYAVGRNTAFDSGLSVARRQIEEPIAVRRLTRADAEVTVYREAVAAADRAMKEAARIMAVAGDPDALLWDLRDRGAPPPFDDWLPAA